MSCTKSKTTLWASCGSPREVGGRVFATGDLPQYTSKFQTNLVMEHVRH